VQSVSQLEGVYGRSAALALRDPLKSQLFYRPSELATAQFIEQQLGQVAAYVDFYSAEPRWRQPAIGSRSERPVPLMTAQDILQIPSEDGSPCTAICRLPDCTGQLARAPHPGRASRTAGAYCGQAAGSRVAARPGRPGRGNRWRRQGASVHLPLSDGYVTGHHDVLVPLSDTTIASSCSRFPHFFILSGLRPAIALGSACGVAAICWLVASSVVDCVRGNAPPL
jgi:hypothetical protein